MPVNKQRLPHHTCPFCGTVYSVHQRADGLTAYHTAICSACGDVMAEWRGKARYYRRKPTQSDPDRYAAAIVAIAAEAAKPERRVRSRRGATHKRMQAAKRSNHEGPRKRRPT